MRKGMKPPYLRVVWKKIYDAIHEPHAEDIGGDFERGPTMGSMNEIRNNLAQDL